jgi:hypothetical protein
MILSIKYTAKLRKIAPMVNKITLISYIKKKYGNSNFPDKTLYMTGESSILKLKNMYSKVWRKN